MNINWSLVTTEVHTLLNPFKINDNEFFTGLRMVVIDEKRDILNEKEYFHGVSSIPFIYFNIFKTTTMKYHLQSVSSISLKTYKVLNYRIEQWGEFDSFELCKQRAINLLIKFKNNLGI